MTKQCIVVVPIYQNDLNPFERISLTQIYKVLGQYDIAVIAPEKLAINEELVINASMIERFPDRFFSGTGGYSALLMSAEFYDRFNVYQYMLICQLDAFVFSDKLSFFCDLGYDYIGAVLPQFWWNGSGVYGDGVGVVGNGGFSLRNVSKCRRICKLKERILWNRLDTKALRKDEDKFFGVCSTIEFLNFKVPPRHIAEKFSVEYDVDRLFERVKSGNIPFGCHGWYNSEFSFWRPFIEAQGYTFAQDDVDKFTQSDMSERIYNDYCGQYWLLNNITHDEILSDILPCDREICVWGAGDVGKRCLKLLGARGIDNVIVIGKTGCGIYPSKEVLSDKTRFIIIASTKFQKEMEQALLQYDKANGRDYITYLELTDKIIPNKYTREHVDYSWWCNE
ncbi:MAG: DUF5672 family protein [Selenomonadaceae bacterium]|nr:DUF5672 family protein [Selenomonadaceae bacterium]